MKQILRSLFLLLLAVVWGGEVLAATGDKFTLVTSESDLKAGDVIIIANISAKKALGTKQNANNRSAEDITITGTTATTTANVQEITLEGESGAWYFNVGTGYLYAAGTKSNQNYMKTQSTKDNNSKAVLTFSSNTVSIVFQATSTNTNSWLRYNNGNTLFSCYGANKQQAVSIYKKTSNLTATTLTFPNAEINVEEGSEASFASQTATLKAGDETLTGKTISYKATGDAIFASFDETTGAAALKTGSFGTATITATYAGDDTYATSSASYKVNYTEKPKTATTLAFVDAPTGVKNIGDEFQLHTSLTAGSATVDADVTFDSSDKTVATIDADGNVKALAKGTTTITATFAGNDTYASSEASFLLTVADPNETEENFDFSDCTKYGYEKPESNNKRTPVEEGQTIISGNVAITVATNGGTKTGFGTNYLGVYTGNKLTLEVKKGYLLKSIAITQSDNNKSLYINNIQGKTWTGEAQYVTLSVNGKGAQINGIKVVYTKLPTLTLSESDTDVAATLTENKGKTVNVKLQRTLKANVWNTICLPFDVTADDVKNVLKAEGNVRAYDSEDAATSSITFKGVESMTAGTPYLIKPTEGMSELTFESVTISTDEPGLDGSSYGIIGTFAPYDMKTNGTELFLGSDGKFYVPGEGKNTMNGFRAYFLVPSGTSAANVNINFGDATGISGVAADAVKTAKVYNLSGQYVGTSLEALPKGIYVVNGKKVLK